MGCHRLSRSVFVTRSYCLEYGRVRLHNALQVPAGENPARPHSSAQSPQHRLERLKGKFAKIILGRTGDGSMKNHIGRVQLLSVADLSQVGKRVVESYEVRIVAIARG